MKLGNPKNTIEVIQKYDFDFQKKFGQNFLIDERVLEKIISAAEVNKDDFVLEIGPGIGTMTQYLAENAREVMAVEIDKNLIPILSDTLKNYSNVTVINEDILKLDTNEAIVDLGAYDGDTIREFTSFTNGKYNRILALEPDAKSYKKLVKNTAKMPDLEALNMGAWNEKDTLIFAKEQSRNSHISASGVPVKVTDIDSLVDYPVTLIKMDIEGSEMKALDGATKTIKRNLPKLYVCAYHRNEDLFALGKKILSFDKRYKLYFRHSLYIPAWESNFYAIID